MKYIKDDIWKYQSWDSLIVVTTNGFIKRNGECVMGRGIALQAKNKFPGIALSLGEGINKLGNHVLLHLEYQLISFPVKHNWWEQADLELIRRSCIELKEFMEIMTESYKIKEIYMTKPGCHNGKRDWETEVKPIMEEFFNQEDRLIICDLE